MKEISGLNTLGNSILCTIDLSESSKPAIQWAVTLAQQLKIPLTILYTYRLLQYRNGEVLQLKRKMEDEAKQQFMEFEKELLIDRGISYNFKTEVGFVTDRIEDHARKNSLSFLVMNKNANESGKETIDDLMEHIHVPVLLVP
jgi:nucleotide-binding universal stress UspA family protein